MSTTSDVKKAEFARLFDLFERLASRRSPQLTSTDAPMDDMPTSQELDPVLKKISAIVDTSKTSTRPRRNTVASIIAKGPTGDSDMPGVSEEGTTAISDDEDDDDIESLAEFPLANAKKYPFTFRLMVHKLYRKDDWARTIKEMLEKSKNEFKPLAEQEVAVTPEDKEEEESGQAVMDGMVRFKVATSPSAGGRRGSVVAGRQRSQSTVGVAFNKALSPLAPGLKSSGSGADTQSDVRALKKRCVGRRKSMSGPLNAEVAGKPRGTWVYNAAVSASERPVATTFNTFPPGPPPSPTKKYRPLGAINLPSNIQGGAGMKRRVSTGCEVPLLILLQHVTNTNVGGLAARRRVMMSNKMDDDSEEHRKRMKRPFAS